MRRSFVVGLAAVMVALAACSNGGSTNNDGGGGAAGGTTGGGGSGGGSGGSGGSAPKSCAQIRMCTVDPLCADEACLTNCKQGADSAALAAFDALESCTRTTGLCPRGSADYINCYCMAQCLQDPPCAPEVDACLGAVGNDPVCEIICH